MAKTFEKATVLNFKAMIDYAEGGVVSKQVLKNSAGNMPLAVCWNVASAVVHLQGEAGTAVHSITRLSGNV